MRRIGFYWAAVAWTAASMLAPTGASAGGLSTQIGEAVIENLQIGRTYNLADLANLHLVVTNTGDAAVDLKMDVLYPSDTQLRLEAMPIPDTSWVSLSQSWFDLSPGDMALSDITITIPDSKELLGKKYQFNVWSHTVPRGGTGMALAYGLRTRIIFTIDSVIADKADKEGTIVASKASTEFSLFPAEIYVDDVTLGDAFAVDEESGIVLTLTNSSEHKQEIHLESRRISESVASLTPGYRDAPDASFLSFDQSTIALPPNATRTIRMYLNFPAGKEYRGEKYMFIIHAYSEGNGVRSGVYSRLYASTK